MPPRKKGKKLYAIEKILAHRGIGDTLEYFVKWKTVTDTFVHEYWDSVKPEDSEADPRKAAKTQSGKKRKARGTYSPQPQPQRRLRVECSPEPGSPEVCPPVEGETEEVDHQEERAVQITQEFLPDINDNDPEEVQQAEEQPQEEEAANPFADENQFRPDYKISDRKLEYILSVDEYLDVEGRPMAAVCKFENDPVHRIVEISYLRKFHEKAFNDYMHDNLH